MSEITLGDGRSLTVDLYKISINDYRTILKKETTPDEEDEILGKAVGLSGDEVRELPYPDYRLLTKSFFDAARNPLADPNSESASTST